MVNLIDLKKGGDTWNIRLAAIHPNDLSGQTALVTARKLGAWLQVCQGDLSRACGAKVVLTARRVERLESLAEEIRGEGGEALPLRLDVNDDDNLMEVVAQTENALGPA